MSGTHSTLLHSTLHPNPGPLRPAAPGFRISYFGPQNTNTHAAALLLFGENPNYLPELTKTGVFDAVESGRADAGVVPIENSSEGVVRETIDCLIQRSPLIQYEFEMSIENCLMAQPGWDPSTGRIVSHPQPLAQCRKWLERNFPTTPQETAASTASAAELASHDRSVAAIANPLAALSYELLILHENIADRNDNATRFICIGRNDSVPSGHDRTSLVLTTPHERGALLRVISVFDDAGVNLTRIESRPLLNHKWEYAFVIDLEGHREVDPARTAIEQLKKMGVLLRLLGSYQRIDAQQAVR
jgi:chorismate mutase / prephenate dehydratase